MLKGFTSEWQMTSKGGERDRRGYCLWRTDDGRDLWWGTGSDVVPASAAAKSDKAAKPNNAPGGPLPNGSV